MSDQLKGKLSAIRAGAVLMVLAGSIAAIGPAPAEANHRVIKGLIKANKVIYYCVGWEAGRMLSIKKYGRAGDPGKCPKGFWLK